MPAKDPSPTESVLSQADQFLLEQIRAGEQAAWAKLVERYEGRLTAFARARLSRRTQGADPEDLVQDTFLSFLKGLERFRAEAGLETYLFTILRRKIIDIYRGKNLAVCSLSELAASEGDNAADSPHIPELPADQPAASWYARRDEQQSQDAQSLARSIKSIIDDFKSALRFRDLQLTEMIFYAQLRNKDIAQQLDMTEQQVALFKHRWLKRVRDKLEAPSSDGAATPQDEHESTYELSDTMLTGVWEAHRFSCPKRSTIGNYLLGTLDDPWRDYIAFHLDKLGCRFCLANLTDLQTQADQAKQSQGRQRIFESTVGFLRSG